MSSDNVLRSSKEVFRCMLCSELTNVAKPLIQVEDEGKFRCKTCKKLFKAAPFVEKHILNKHPETFGDRLEQVSLLSKH